MAFEELKQRASVAWGAAAFEKVADQIANIHDQLVAELSPRRVGESVVILGTRR